MSNGEVDRYSDDDDDQPTYQSQHVKILPVLVAAVPWSRYNSAIIIFYRPVAVRYLLRPSFL